jgi:hypothetical protein
MGHKPGSKQNLPKQASFSCTAQLAGALLLLIFTV